MPTSPRPLQIPLSDGANLRAELFPAAGETPSPGVVVLHDFVLHHLVAGMTLGRGDG